ncbi:YHYH protein [Winogradskyella vidalii]|uniref:YHYH protein n=1 Tax=Winogradskyella vidalii TaxID=2615024 RepID=UPI0015CB6FB6|nr:YHYH protein [Winogradskyella vidalii]
MKNGICNALTIVGVLCLLGCNSHRKTTEHTHDGLEAHSHDVVSESNNETRYFGSYELEDENFGTKTKMTITSDKRVMVTNALPNHKTGQFPNQGNPNTISEQNKTYSFPLYPKYTGKAQWVREPGIALNGIKFEPGTAEVVECETGENYRVEAFQDVIDLGLDFNNAHVQPTGAYHYHGSPTSVIQNFDSGEDLVHIGFAHDGFPIYYSKSGAYKSSFKPLDGNREGEDCVYDNPGQHIDVAVGGHHDGTFTSDFEYVAGYGDLDECNGIMIDDTYMYVVTNEFPYVSRCLMGEFENEERKGPLNGGGGRDQAQRPNAKTIISNMDANKDGKLSKDEVKGPLVDAFSEIDSNGDGYIAEAELKKENRGKRQGSQRNRK